VGGTVMVVSLCIMLNLIDHFVFANFRRQAMRSN
jgi:hypothetical protein